MAYLHPDKLAAVSRTLARRQKARTVVRKPVAPAPAGGNLIVNLAALHHAQGQVRK